MSKRNIIVLMVIALLVFIYVSWSLGESGPSVVTVTTEPGSP